MDEIKHSTQKAVALAMILSMVLFAVVLISSLVAYKGLCIDGEACSRFEYAIQRLAITLAASWKLIILVAATPYLVYAVRHFKDKKKNK